MFCAIVRGEAPATFVRQWPQAVAICPRNPVTEGHVLVLPKAHVRDAADDPGLAGITMHAAADLARVMMLDEFNIITSAGVAATQTVFHLHVHLVPRRLGDGLALPWTGPR